MQSLVTCEYAAWQLCLNAFAEVDSTGDYPAWKQMIQTLTRASVPVQKRAVEILNEFAGLEVRRLHSYISYV